MGLIKTGVKWGAIGYVAHQGFKAVNSNKQSPPPQQPMYYPPQQQPQQPNQTRDVNGYIHQSWCNGQCGSHCNDNQNAVNGQNMIRSGEADSYYESPAPAYQKQAAK